MAANIGMALQHEPEKGAPGSGCADNDELIRQGDLSRGGIQGAMEGALPSRVYAAGTAQSTLGVAADIFQGHASAARNRIVLTESADQAGLTTS